MVTNARIAKVKLDITHKQIEKIRNFKGVHGSEIKSSEPAKLDIEPKKERECIYKLSKLC